MRKHPLIRPTSLTILLTILAGPLSAWGDEQAPPKTPAPDRRLIVAGSEGILWLVISEWNEQREEFTRRFIYRDAGTDRLNPVVVAPQRSRIAVAAVVGNTLHAFFRDGSHVRFSKTRRFTGHYLPGKRVPLAVAGEVRAGQGRLWAVVPVEVADEVRDEWQESQKRRATKPGDDVETLDSSVQPTISSLPQPNKDSKAPELVLYDGTVWQPGMPMPVDCADAEQVWLAVADGRFHLLWMTDRDPGHVHYAHFDDDRWMIGASISLSAPVEKAAAAVTNKQVVFAALLKQDNLATLECRQWSRGVGMPVQEAWHEVAPLLNDKGQPQVLAAGSALGLFSDRLALMRFGTPEPELGLWIAGAGGKPDLPFEAVPPLGRDGPGSGQGLQDLVATLIVAAMLLILFWRRQEAIASPLELPVELQVAGPARRAAAFLVDAAPAAAVMLFFWFDPIMAFWGGARAAAKAGTPMPEMPAQLLWAWFWFRVLYVLYSALFEWFTATTPGKRLLGCVVLSETLGPATMLQITIRNAARMIELEPFLKIWPFLLIVFFTRNRQRLGDLLARTIVVEQRWEASPDGDVDENREE